MRRSSWIFAGGIALVLLATLFASRHPDGLERVAEDLGFTEKGTVLLPAPMPDYSGAPTPLLGLVGASVVGLLSWSAGRALARRP